MKIIVCMKQVPASTKVDIDPETGAMKRLSSATRTNPYDLFALETALQLRDLILQACPNARPRIETVGPVVGIYTGVGCVGIAFRKKEG